MGASDGLPLTCRRIAGLMLMKMVGGSFLTGATGGVFVFLTLAASRSTEMVMVAEGFRKVLIRCSICAEVAASSEGNEMLVILGSLRKTVWSSMFTDEFIRTVTTPTALAAGRSKGEGHSAVHLL